MNKKNNAKHSSKQVRKKFGVPNLDAELAAETGAVVNGADTKSPKGSSQKAKK